MFLSFFVISCTKNVQQVLKGMKTRRNPHTTWIKIDAYPIKMMMVVVLVVKHGTKTHNQGKTID